MVLSPGEDGVYGATNRTGGELFDAILDYIASKGGCEDVLPGKSTEQLMDIISAATFDAQDSDDLAVDLTFIGASSFGEVIKLNPIASVYIGEPLIVNGTAELEDGDVVILWVISGPCTGMLPHVCVEVEDGQFSATLDTYEGVVGTSVMAAEDMKGNMDTETFELLASVPTSTEQGIGSIKAALHSEAKVEFDMPHSVASGETVDVRGYSSSASGNLDLVIDDILMVDDLIIPPNGEFEWEWNTRKPLPDMGAYTPGVSVIKAYVNCHVADVSAGDYVRTEYKHLEPDGVCGLRLISSGLTAEINVNNITKGDPIIVRGIATGTDAVDIVIVGPKGLKKLPDSFFSEDAIADGLFFTSAEVDVVDYAFEKMIRIPGDADFGDYRLLIFTAGRDGLYALTTRNESELFDALQDYGFSPNDFVSRSQEQIIAMLQEATLLLPGDDDLLLILSFNVGLESPYKTWHVDDDFKDYPEANFSSIQDAIFAASIGDKIIVHNGTYVENVKIARRGITIVSANGAENTIVQAANSNDQVFTVMADHVNINGFTVKGATGTYKAGIYLYHADYCNILNNNCSNSYYGIYFYYLSNNNIITNNKCSNNRYGIYLRYSSINSITNNNCSNNGDGICIEHSSNNNVVTNNKCYSNNRWGICLMGSNNNNSITNNSCLNNFHGIALVGSNNNIIKNNNCLNNNYGILLGHSSNNSVIENNNCSNNVFGIYLYYYSSNNIISLNNFINNTDNVYSSDSTNIWNSTEKITYTYNGKTYTNYLGNYWSDYTDTDANDDGIWDKPRPIGSDKDYHPLVEPFENYISLPEWRKDIIPGDILYCPTIRGKVNHVGLYVGDGKVVEVCFPTGVAETSIEEWDYPEKNDVTLLRVDCSNEVREKAVSFAKAQVGDDFEPAWLLWKKNPDPDSDYWYCSELVWVAYYNQGVDIEYTPDPWIVTPLEIYMDEDTFVIGSHKKGHTTDGIAIMGRCPVNLTVTDPDNLTISEDVNEISGALYLIDDFDEDGTPDDLIAIPEQKLGDYKVTVIPEPDASPTETYTVEVFTGYTTVLAENKTVEEIPSEPYIFKSRKEIYIPDDFVTIQDAVNASSDSDVIIVYNGTYVENVDVNKSITIVSANGAENTTVQAVNSNDHVFEVTANYVNISGFTVKGASGIKAGIYLESDTNHCIISNNNASNNDRGIHLYYSSNNIMTNNIASNSRFGIILYYSSNNIITNNAISNNRGGIYSWRSSGNTLTHNNILNNFWYGVLLGESSSNKVYLNNFINDSQNVDSRNSTNTWNSTKKITYTYKGNQYTNYTGNYWDDYNGTDANNDGIGDTPHPVNSDKDYYPLVEPWENYSKPAEENIFDTGPSEISYPSIFGIHNGTIKPAHDVNVSKMYTYPCAGTGGHSEWAAFYNSTTGEEIANGTWKGYAVGDYHYIEFDKEFVLREGVTYNYTIKTGSYPQIIHNQTFTNEYGTITCTKFTDANGKIYTDWIPAIRLE